MVPAGAPAFGIGSDGIASFEGSRDEENVAWAGFRGCIPVGGCYRGIGCGPPYMEIG